VAPSSAGLASEASEKERLGIELLLRAGTALAESLDPDLILDRVTALLVPDLADWCVIDTAEGSGLRQHVISHVDADKIAWARKLRAEYPLDHDAASGPMHVIRTGEPEIYPTVTPQLVRERTRNEEHYRLALEVGMVSAMIVPMIARGRTLGAITIVSAESGRHYDEQDLGIARALGARTALAVDNARLFQQMQEAGLGYRTLVETIEGIVWEAHPSTPQFRFVSGRAERILGYPVAQWLQEGFLERIVHPEDRERALDQLRSAAATPSGEPDDREIRVYAADGRLVWLRNIVYTGPRGSGDRSMHGLMVDVTERKGADRRLAAHLAATRALAEARDLPETAHSVLQAICGALDWEVGALWMVDSEARVLRCVEATAQPSSGTDRFAAVTRASTFQPGVGLPGRVWSSESPLWVSDVTIDANFPRASVAVADGLHSALAFPIVSRGSVVGVVEFFSRWIEEPDEQLLAIMRTVGAAIGRYLERRWAEEEVKFQKALLESQSETTIDGVLVVATDGVTILQANRRFAELWGVTEDVLKPGRSATELSSIFEQFAHPAEGAREVLQIFQDSSVQSRKEVRLRDGRIFDRYTAPLYSTDGHLYGRAWYFRDVTDRVRTQQQLAAAKERTEFLADASAVFSASLDSDAILSSLARLAVPFLADWCTVDVVADDGHIRRVAVTHADPALTEIAASLAARTDYPPEEGGCVGRVLGTALPEIQTEEFTPAAMAGDSDPEYRAIVGGLGVNSYMSVPLVARGRTLGAITFAVTGTSGRRYAQGDLTLGEDLARRAALAVDNSRLYRDQAHIARVLQTSLLPPDLPRIPGMELAASYHAAGEGNEVGGDFYDVFRTGPGDWAVVIGDVCGKGADAAALTALVRYTVRAAAMQARKPKRILAALNEAILLQREEREFCTVGYARLRPTLDGARLTMCCGGHPLPLILRADGLVEPAAKPGSLIGVFPQPDLSDILTELGPGDAVVMYTDGVTEARSPDGVFGDHLLDGVLAQCVGLSANEICKRIETAVLDFQAGRPRDDIAIVVLRVAPVGER
jgi:PAS domain S-box-containing protein